MQLLLSQAGKPEFEAKQKELQAVMNTASWSHSQLQMTQNDSK